MNKSPMYVDQQFVSLTEFLGTQTSKLMGESIYIYSLSNFMKPRDSQINSKCNVYLE